jgi:hypothetical protein
MTLFNTCGMEFCLIMGAMWKQFPSQLTFSLSLERWTSTRKLALSSVIAYYIDGPSGLPQVQLTFHQDLLQFTLYSES